MPWFFITHAGKGMAGIILSVLFLAFPTSLYWLVTVATFAFGVGHIRAAVRAPVAPARRKRDVEPVDVAAALSRLARSEQTSARGRNHQPVVLDVRID